MRLVSYSKSVQRVIPLLSLPRRRTTASLSFRDSKGHNSLIAFAQRPVELSSRITFRNYAVSSRIIIPFPARSCRVNFPLGRNCIARTVTQRFSPPPGCVSFSDALSFIDRGEMSNERECARGISLPGLIGEERARTVRSSRRLRSRTMRHITDAAFTTTTAAAIQRQHTGATFDM